MVSESQEEDEGNAESATGHCNTVPCFCGKDVLLTKTQLHKWIPLKNTHKRNVKLINREHTTLLNNFQVLSPLSFLESS